MKTSTFRAFKAHVSLWKFFAALLLAWICVPMSQASVQNNGQKKVACWVLTKPKGKGTLTFTYAEGGDLSGKRLDNNNQVVDAHSAEGEWIIDGAPIDANCSPEWIKSGENDPVRKEHIETVVFDESFAQFRPTSCKEWFDGCAHLTEITGIKYLNTEDVENMSYMFYGCAALTSLDLSSFQTWSLSNTQAMFGACSSLQSIYASDWDSKGLTVYGKSDHMFLGCTNLVGEAAYNESKTDATMANAQTGYFMPHFSDGNLNVTYFEKDEKNRIVLNLYNADPFVVSMEHHIYKGTYTRQNMPSTWGTVCVPFIIDVKNAETNCEIYKFQKVEGENLFIEKVEEGEIAAGTPVIVKRTNGTALKVCSPEGYQTIVTEPVPGTGTSHIEGTFVEKQLKGTSNYFIAKDKFWQVSGYDKVGNTIAGVIVPPFRATITTESTQAQSLGIVVVGETNSIDQTPTVDNLLSDKAEYFDLQGRRLDGPQKGINLVRMGGKTRKVVIK